MICKFFDMIERLFYFHWQQTWLSLLNSGDGDGGGIFVGGFFLVVVMVMVFLLLVVMVVVVLLVVVMVVVFLLVVFLFEPYFFLLGGNDCVGNFFFVCGVFFGVPGGFSSNIVLELFSILWIIYRCRAIFFILLFSTVELNKLLWLPLTIL